MTVYSASNIMAVNLSDAHGGCGSPHARPVRNGAPDKLWKLDCVMCENHLRTDPLWSTTVSEIPETYDEKSTREDWEKRGAQDRDAIMPLLLAKLAGVDPSDLRHLAAHSRDDGVPKGARPAVRAGLLRKVRVAHARRGAGRIDPTSRARAGSGGPAPAEAPQNVPGAGPR